jgi:hypothetical protein
MDSSRQTTHAVEKTSFIREFQLAMRSWISQNFSRKVSGVDTVNRSPNVMAKKRRRGMYLLMVNDGVLFSSSSESSLATIVIRVTGLQKSSGGFM